MITHKIPCECTGLTKQGVSSTWRLDHKESCAGAFAECSEGAFPPPSGFRWLSAQSPHGSRHAAVTLCAGCLAQQVAQSL